MYLQEQGPPFLLDLTLQTTLSDEQTFSNVNSCRLKAVIVVPFSFFGSFMEFPQIRCPKFNYGLFLKSFDFILIREGSQNFFKYTFAYIKEDLGKNTIYVTIITTL